MLHRHTNHHTGHSLLHARRQLRKIKVDREEYKKAKNLHELFEMVRAIKVSRNKQEALRRVNVDALKQAGFYEAVCQCVGSKRWFDADDVEALSSELSSRTSPKS
ncbi:hypothetical protein [Vibrio maritimus]|uniref:hypothetical protein n=1 Tax=Vibrio maritimus TaxID=990268 RepID=UPI0037354EC5